MKTVAICVGLLSAVSVAEANSNPGLKAMWAASTDIAVVEVLETQPRRSPGGARDTAQLKVHRVMKGTLEIDETIGLYYHLAWVDTQPLVLEDPKFHKGKRYVVFLKRWTIRENGIDLRVEFELADQWFGVLPEHPDLVRELREVIWIVP
jgi:hypothetical protein